MKLTIRSPNIRKGVHFQQETAVHTNRGEPPPFADRLPLPVLHKHSVAEYPQFVHNPPSLPLGSFSALMIAYALPSIMYFVLFNKRLSRTMIILDPTVFVISIVLIVICVGHSLMDTVHSSFSVCCKMGTESKYMPPYQRLSRMLRGVTIGSWWCKGSYHFSD